MRHLIIAMIVAWLIHLLYLVSLARRQQRLHQEAEELRRLVDQLDRSPEP
jgi:biopolymer transport protein ExbB/TolQ